MTNADRANTNPTSPDDPGRDAPAADQRWLTLLDYGRRQAEHLGIEQGDIARLIASWRQENRS